MRKKEASFWSDIKALDDRLAKDPDSYCFARLSEVYLKVGLLSDALNTARTGVAKHPGYIAGQRALAMACHASGLHDECRSILEQVCVAMPEDVDALKILAHLYAEKGDDASAIRAYRTLLEFKPEDTDSKAQLEALLEGGDGVSRNYVDDDLDATDFKVPLEQEDDFGDEQDTEEIYELDESDIVCDESIEEPVAAAPVIKTSYEHHDPLSTATLAELYVQQGFYAKALDIYRAVLADDPGNDAVRAKVAQLEERESDRKDESEQTVAVTSDGYEAESDVEAESPIESEPAAGFDQFASEALDETTVAFDQPEAEQQSGFVTTSDEIPAPYAFLQEPGSVPPPVIENAAAPVETAPFAPLQNQTADNVLNTLDGWLENIRRIKACR